MAVYRKKPVEVEAFQYDGDLMDSHGNYYVPDWAVTAFLKGDIYYSRLFVDDPPSELFIKTLEGVMHVSIGDYIIKGVYDEIYSCQRDIFEETYELISD